MLDDPTPRADPGVRDDTDALDPVVARAAAALRLPVPLGLEFDDRVMLALHREAPTLPRVRVGRQLTSMHRWATTPRGIRVSPIGSLGMAAAIAAALLAAVWLGRWSVTGGSSVQEGIAASQNSTVEHRPYTTAVQFVVTAPGATRVALVGDFNEWNPMATALRATERAGVWSVIVPLAPGRHEYAFVVDGERWMHDPAAPRAASDDFGRPNSVVTVPERS